MAVNEKFSDGAADETAHNQAEGCGCNGKSQAPTAPFCSIIGAKAADDPTPPIREIEPAHMPSRGFKPNARAIATPPYILYISMTEEVQNNIKIAIPPFFDYLKACAESNG